MSSKYSEKLQYIIFVLHQFLPFDLCKLIALSVKPDVFVDTGLEYTIIHNTKGEKQFLGNIQNLQDIKMMIHFGDKKIILSDQGLVNDGFNCIAKNIKFICEISNNMLMLTNSGHLWDYNNKKRLVSDIHTIHSGKKHAIAVTKKNQLYVWGDNEVGQLGLAHTVSVKNPQLHPIRKILTADCGNYYSLILTLDNKLFESGSCLGLKYSYKYNLTEIKNRFAFGEVPVAISCGQSHYFVLTSKRTVYSWGDNSCGQLGYNSGMYICSPVKVDINQRIRYISCGSFHTVLVTDQDRVYGCGSNEFKQLGVNGTKHKFSIIS